MEKYDIFIEAGQSNAEGYGHGPVKDPYIPDDRILYLLNTKQATANTYPIEIAQERPFKGGYPDDRIGDLALTFATRYIQAGLLEEGRKILIVRCAKGGTGFMYNQWEMNAPLYLRMLDMADYALSLNPENRLMGMLWHQGEHEAYEGNQPDRYHGQLLALVQSVKQRYNCPNLPFICGGFCNEWKIQYLESCKEILAVIRDVAAILNGAFIETEDLLSNNQKNGDGDVIHFCRESLQILGNRYFDAYQSIIKNT